LLVSFLATGLAFEGGNSSPAQQAIADVTIEAI
jgi:hypothetical protein